MIDGRRPCYSGASCVEMTTSPPTGPEAHVSPTDDAGTRDRFEIQLSHLCNNRCVFCVSGQMTQLRRTRPTPLGDLRARFDEARARGIDEVTIMGGEPTIHPTFFPILDYAIELGFGRIVIFTNGARLDQAKFLDRILAYGADRFSWRISIQGWDEATHDATTRKPGAFRRIVAGMQTLGRLGQRVECNMCVVEQNYRSLEALPEFVTRHPVKEVHLDMVRPRDAGERTEDYLDGIMPDYTALGDVLDRMFRRLEEVAPDFDVRIGNLPPCRLPAWAHRIHHGGVRTFTASADGFGEVSAAWDKYEDKRSDKRKRPTCSTCAFDSACDGFFELYGRRRGVDGFTPVHRADLRRIDPRQRTFLHQLRAPLHSVLGGPLPPGWSPRSAQEHEADRMLEAGFRHAGGGSARLRVVPADVPDGGDGEHDDFALLVHHWDAVEFPAVVDLLAHVFDALARALGSPQQHVRRRPSAARMLARRSLDVDPTALPARIAAALSKLLHRPAPTAGWSLAEARMHPPRGVRMTYRGPEGIEAVVNLAEEAGRFRGRWTFAPTHRLEQRALAAEVNRMLGGEAPPARTPVPGSPA
jgi:MoaA/NifB/PqqE/SkfB family radical SAM enzyme